MYGDMYIGGVPKDFHIIKNAVKTNRGFRGCIGEATMNGGIINFADAIDKKREILGKCILDKQVEKIDDADLHEGIFYIFDTSVVSIFGKNI